MFYQLLERRMSKMYEQEKMNKFIDRLIEIHECVDEESCKFCELIQQMRDFRLTSEGKED